jgi:general secretion pathway protein H
MIRLSHSPPGFTLIEIMVVIVIIGVILSFATLSIGSGGLEQKLEQEAQRLASLLQLASQEAIMQSQEMGVSFEPHRYEFYILQGQQWQKLTASDNIFRPRTLPVGIQVEIRLEGEPIILNEVKNTPQLLILSSGEFIPFEIIFFVEEVNENLRYLLKGSTIGEMSIQRDDDVF